MKDAYISAVSVDLWNQAVTLNWAGIGVAIRFPDVQKKGFGKETAGADCDDAIASRKAGINCAAKKLRILSDWAYRLSGFPIGRGAAKASGTKWLILVR